MAIRFLAVFGAAFLTALLLAEPVRRLGLRLGIVAVPGGRRRHRDPVPTLGSVVVFGGFLVGAALVYVLLPPAGSDRLLLRGVLIGLTVMFAGGLIDDWRELPAGWLFALQGAGAVIAIAFDVIVGRFTNPLTGIPVDFGQVLAVVFTLFWVLGMVNTVNFLDGLDGLAGGIGAIAALLFAWHSYSLGQVAVAAFPLALAGALLGFLPFNFAPARLFLGSGAFVLGYALATLSILAPAKIATALLVLAVPIVDVAWQIISRLRRGQSPFRGDRGHLHFRLADSGLPTRTIVLGYYAIAICFGLVALLAPPAFKLAMLLLLTFVVVVLFVVLVRRGRREDGVKLG